MEAAKCDHLWTKRNLITLTNDFYIAYYIKNCTVEQIDPSQSDHNKQLITLTLTILSCYTVQFKITKNIQVLVIVN
jgi:hypothetical protein